MAFKRTERTYTEYMMHEGCANGRDNKGQFIYTGVGKMKPFHYHNPLHIPPTENEHRCDKCGAIEYFDDIYPKIKRKADDDNDHLVYEGSPYAKVNKFGDLRYEYQDKNVNFMTVKIR